MRVHVHTRGGDLGLKSLPQSNGKCKSEVIASEGPSMEDGAAHGRVVVVKRDHAEVGQARASCEGPCEGPKEAREFSSHAVPKHTAKPKPVIIGDDDMPRLAADVAGGPVGENGDCAESPCGARGDVPARTVGIDMQFSGVGELLRGDERAHGEGVLGGDMQITNTLNVPDYRGQPLRHEVSCQGSVVELEAAIFTLHRDVLVQREDEGAGKARSNL